MTLSNLLFKYRIFHENKQFLSSFEMCCLICFHLKVDFSVQWCTAREQVCCVFMLFHWWSRALSGKLLSVYYLSSDRLRELKKGANFKFVALKVVTVAYEKC